MDQLRHLLATTNVVGSDSGIDGCTSGSWPSSSLPNQPNTSNSEATSALIDLSDTHEDIPLTDDDNGYLVSDDDGVCNEDQTDDEEQRRHFVQRLSTDSGSTFEIVGYQSPESLDEGWCGAEANVNPETGTSVKISENDKIEERDTYSPIVPSDGEPDEGIVSTLRLTDMNGDDENNKLFRRNLQLCDRGRLSSKEEKQRQNEEIVIMESSSVSSETGSWESVFPQRTPTAEQTESCNVFIKNERQHHCGGPTVPPPSLPPVVTAPKPKPEPRELPEFSYSPKPTTSIGACFIDASSLMDDTEVYSSLTGPHLPEIGCCGPAPTIEDLGVEMVAGKTSDFDITNVGAKDDTSNSTPDLHSPNLSDEQKLLHRETEHKIDYDIKDQFSIDLNCAPKRFSPPIADASLNIDSPPQLPDEGIVVSTSNTSCSEKSDSDSRVRQEQERKQGNFLFKNSIQHYSGNVLAPKVPYIERDENYSDLSLPSIYSTGSEPYNNDFGQAFETGSQYSSNFSDVTSEIAMSDAESGFFPDTPHNSIVHIETPPRSRSRADGRSHTSPDGVIIPKRAFKCDESAPIVSGGASIKDFTPRLCESPSVRRKTETCPILSGGMGADDFEVDPVKAKKIVDKPKITSLSTWVVDMSDCLATKGNRRRSESSSSSTDNMPSTRSVENTIERSGSGSSHKSGLGFYVSLDDMKPPAVKSEAQLDQAAVKAKRLEAATQPSESMRRSTGFYVDMSESESSRNSTPQREGSAPRSDSADKKNIFSMFIDIGEKKAVPRKEPAAFTSRLSSSLQKQRDMLANVSDCDSIGSSDDPTAGAVIRRSHSPASRSDNSKRHSWNVATKERSVERPSRDYARSVSLSTADNSIMSILDKIPLISKTSSMSIDSPNSPYDDFTCSKSLSTYSNNSNSLTSNSIHSSVDSHGKTEVLPDVMATSMRKRRQDVKINETFDKSSQGSLTDGVLSKDSSPTTDTDDVTFQNDEEMVSSALIKNNPIMETIIEQKETASPKKVASNTTTTTVIMSNGQSKTVETHTMEMLQATIEKQKLLLETVNEEVPMSSFVKLSDMDKPAQKFELHSTDTLSKSVGSTTRIGRLFVDSKTRNSWHTMSRSTGNNLTNLASSVENLKSLSRLFPHLSKDLSSSLPADIQIDDLHNKSPVSGEYGDYVQTDLSCTSSLTSSFSRSGIDSADESSLSCRQPRRLGEDLLKMFLQEIATDVILEVGGRRMRAHRCILRSRCQYFAAIFAGGWQQTTSNVVTLPGYSFGSVHFALCHIYSGASHPPEGISLMELAALADLLGLEGLKEVTAHALRTNYCHNFHSPCSGCFQGVLQVLPVSLNHGLDELYRKCLRWVCKHYKQVWLTRAFAELPPDIIGRCKQHLVAHLTSETVLSVILDCDDMLSMMPPVAWCNRVANTVRDINDTAQAYVSDHFASLVASDAFLSLGHSQSWHITILENLLLRIASTLTADQACRSYQRVTRLNAVLGAKVLKLSSSGLRIDEDPRQRGLNHEEEMDWSPEFLRLVSAILSSVEQCLTRQCARAMRNHQWQRMDLELRKKIQKLACLSDPMETRRSRSQQSNKPVTYNSAAIANNNRNHDLYQMKLAIQAHSKRTQEAGGQYRASAHTQTNYSVERISVALTDKGVQANHEPRATERAINKVSKSTSRAHVPDLIPTIKPRAERPTSLGHRRSQSETVNSRTFRHSISVEAAVPSVITTINESHPHTSRLTDIKPRYLEPRPLRNSSTIAAPKIPSTLTVKSKNLSSSDSSRNSSPALKRPTGKPKKMPNESTNMSRDSLASPAKQNKSIKNKAITDFEISVDSLGDSLHSSIKTDKTHSQESLVKFGGSKRMAKPSAISNTLALKSNFSRSNPIINKDPAANNRLQPSSAANNKFGSKNKTLSSCTSTQENSPSSIATAKSSRLSSITSAVSSPRESYSNRRSLSTPQTTSAPPKKSFISAKSREILAAKKQTLNHAESTKSVPGLIKERPQMHAVNKSSSTSAMLSKRPISFPTTLHLRRTAKLGESKGTSDDSPVKAASAKLLNSNNKTVAKSKQPERKSKCNVTAKNIINVEIEREEDHRSPSPPLRVIRIESKLERSSTFCKETSDIPNGELQIIE